MPNNGPLYDDKGRQYFEDDALGALRGPVFDILEERTKQYLGVVPSKKRMILQTKANLEILQQQRLPELEIHEVSSKEQFLAKGYTLVG